MNQNGESRGTRAVRAFRQPPLRLNCAQAVAHAWVDDATVAQAEIAKHMSHGGGGAPEGECGALFAARQMAVRQGADPKKLADQFAAALGHTSCRELKKKQASCTECVRMAADLLDVRAH